jgi:hypothetical protein
MNIMSWEINRLEIVTTTCGKLYRDYIFLSFLKAYYFIVSFKNITSFTFDSLSELFSFLIIAPAPS